MMLAPYRGPARWLLPAGATRIDGVGRYVIPGLADMHAHLNMGFYGAGPGLMKPRMKHTNTTAEYLLFMRLANGVTTIRNLDYQPDSGRIVDGATLLRLRARARAGELQSPRIYTSGSWANRQFYQYSIAPESVATYVAAYKAAGYDFLKIHDEGTETVDSIAAATRRVGMRLVGHAFVGNVGSLERFLTSGIVSIEHLTGYTGWSQWEFSYSPDPMIGYTPTKTRTPAATDSIIRVLASATKRARVWNCPTQAWMEVIDQREKSPEETLVRRQLIKALQDAGAGLLLGTDLPAARLNGQPDGDLIEVHHELEALVRAGLTPYQALATGTKNVAAFLETLDSTGTVALRKRADLVLLSGNPLEDIRHAAKPAGVMIGGRWLSRAELDQRLAAIAVALATSP